MCNKILCSFCNKNLSVNNFYKFLIDDNIYKCKKCTYDEFTFLTNKFSSENKALLIMCEKYNIVYDQEFYNKLKKSCKGNLFKNYIRCSRTILKKNSFSKFKIIFEEYLTKNNLKIYNVFTFDYELHFNKSKLINYLNNSNIDPLEFIVNFYDRKYPGYLFHYSSCNYYKDISNLAFDVKFFIEKEHHIKIKDLSSILTTEYLRQNNSLLFYEIMNSKIDGLFNLMDFCYPNTFKKDDFKNTSKKFDSYKEESIDLILKKHFKNVIYNNRSVLNIKLNHMIPDWFILTENGCIICEYFGLYVENTSSDFLDYKRKTLIKLEKYSKFNNYTFLFIYPKDLENNHEMLNDKILGLKKQLNL